VVSPSVNWRGAAMDRRAVALGDGVAADASGTTTDSAVRGDASANGGNAAGCCCSRTGLCNTTDTSLARRETDVGVFMATMLPRLVRRGAGCDGDGDGSGCMVPPFQSVLLFTDEMPTNMAR